MPQTFVLTLEIILSPIEHYEFNIGGNRRSNLMSTINYGCTNITSLISILFSKPVYDGMHQTRESRKGDPAAFCSANLHDRWSGRYYMPVTRCIIITHYWDTIKLSVITVARPRARRRESRVAFIKLRQIIGTRRGIRSRPKHRIPSVSLVV